MALDTNVVFEQMTIADLDRAAERFGDSPEFRHRLYRARDSIILAWYFHRRQWTTGSAFTEVTGQIFKQVPNDDPTVAMAFTTVVGHFVLPHVVPGWKACGFEGVPPNLKGRDIDDFLLAAAKEERIPLITNEGNGLNGVSSDDPKKLRRKAIEAGVQVFTPAQFLRTSGVDYRRSSQEFLTAYDRQLPKFEAEEDRGPGMRRACQEFRQMYEYVLSATKLN